MSYNKVQLVSGLIIVVLPFTGFPVWVKTTVFVAIGIMLIIMSVLSHIHRKSVGDVSKAQQ